MSLYLYQNEQRTGPFSEEQVRQMLQAGSISPDTFGWKEGMADWAVVSTLVSAEAAPEMPPPPRPKASVLGIISFAFSLVSIVGWGVLLVAVGLAHNAGTATPVFNMIVGFIFMGGVLLNFLAAIFGFIGIFKSRANTLAIIGACLNIFLLIGIVVLILIGLAAKQGNFSS